MRQGPRLRILLPVGVLLTLLAPLLRQLPGGALLPDVWLLLLLLAVPATPPDSWRRPIQLVLVFGLLRSSVTALSPFVAWAGFGAGLLVRGALHRRLSEYRFLLRFLVGFCAALPLAILDRVVARDLGAHLSTSDALWASLITGLIVAVVQRPAGRSLSWQGVRK
ncbi:MAG: hypothetical protein ACPG31_11295 [Planctomycetota bacterium]